ncbi:hypothetical protein FF098_002200 [Parvularcula flava]|uniref:Uncharacterized protein n=1 Tax=Aquisalinus luteolus TaxID=1566827 RepID=A0A8J3A0G3_9PROT|nr:hypothetical protein [Aquisalinus luteolus]NHK26718.1 hypothetical protein [Aquisalinus luteolus]GGH93201.1 hypothetical protein GCM10011355_04480 [Aquisalinus luteolus]
MIKWLSTVLVLIASLSFGIFAHACDCQSNGTPQEHIEKSPKVFLGSILSAELGEKYRDPDRDYLMGMVAHADVRVDVAVKGVATGQVVSVAFAMLQTSCGIYPEVGSKMLFILDEDEDFFLCTCEAFFYDEDGYFDVFSTMISAEELREIKLVVADPLYSRGRFR